MIKKIVITLLILMFIPLNADAIVSNEARLEYNKGLDYYKIGQYERAVKYFRSAINISPDFIDAYYNLGSLLEYLKQYDQALTVFQQIIVRQPEDYEAAYKAAYVAYQLKKYEDAMSYITLIPRASGEYAIAQSLAQKIRYEARSPEIFNFPIQAVDTSEQLPQTSHLFEGIQGPTGMVTDDFGNLYVACFADNSITKIFPDGRRVIFAKDRKINGPIGMAIDSRGNLYIANYNSNNVLKITKRSEISVILGNVDKPYGLYIKGNMLYVSSQGSNSVLRYKLPN